MYEQRGMLERTEPVRVQTACKMLPHPCDSYHAVVDWQGDGLPGSASEVMLRSCSLRALVTHIIE